MLHPGCMLLVQGLIFTMADPFVRTTLKGLQRISAKPVVKKEVDTAEMLEAIIDATQKSGTLMDLRLATTCVLGFAGFLRFNLNFETKDDMVRTQQDRLAEGGD